SEGMKEPTMPKHFRDAGHFWGVAAGTPPSVIGRRIAEIDHTLKKARAMLDQNTRDEVASRHGLILFSRADLQHAADFQATLKSRFAKELSTLQAVISLNLLSRALARPFFKGANAPRCSTWDHPALRQDRHLMCRSPPCELCIWSGEVLRGYQPSSTGNGAALCVAP